MKKRPLFSIITVTYNASPWLERTIQSVIAQRAQGVEYIIIDGGSTDGTVGIIRKYETAVSYWVSEPDSGLYDAMNKGLKAARGKYVWFLNAGDVFYAHYTLRKLASLMIRNRYPDILYGETEIMDAEGASLGMRRLKAPEELTWESLRMGMLVCHQSFVVKRSIAKNYDLHYRFTADYDWVIRCLKSAGTIVNTRLILSRFLEAGISTAHRKASLKERYHIMCRYYGTLPTLLRHLWFAVRFYGSARK